MNTRVVESIDRLKLHNGEEIRPANDQLNINMNEDIPIAGQGIEGMKKEPRRAPKRVRPRIESNYSSKTSNQNVS